MPDLDPFDSPDPVAAILAEHDRPAGRRRLLALTTSGTSSGSPRVILRTTASWIDSFAAFSGLTGTSPSSRVWVPGPLSATMNLFAATHAAWAGATRVPTAGQATHAHLTTSAVPGLLRDHAESLPGLTVVVAGDRLPGGLADALVAAGASVHHYYGAAELSFVAWGRDEDSLRVFPGVEVRAVDGELRARSDYVAVSAVPDTDGWYSVGDRGHVTSDDRVVVTGRPGSITVAGTTVQVSTIEAALRPHAPDGVAVVAVPHPRFGQVPGVVVTDAATLPALRAAARTSLVEAARPRRWQVIDAWPLTEQGKLDRVALTALPFDDEAPLT